MPLFKATVKNTRINNGIHLEKGMSVEFESSHVSPLSNGWGKVIEAFQIKYGIDIKKAGATSDAWIEIIKVN